MSYEECGYFKPLDTITPGVHFVFEKGLLGLDHEGVWTSDRDGNVTRHEFCIREGQQYVEIYRQMLCAMRGEPHYPTIHHAAANVRIALAAYASAEKQTEINLKSEQWRLV